MMYKLKCLHCKKESYSFFEAQQQRIAEEHMMETGHIVEITEV